MSNFLLSIFFSLQTLSITSDLHLFFSLSTFFSCSGLNFCFPLFFFKFRARKRVVGDQDLRRFWPGSDVISGHECGSWETKQAENRRFFWHRQEGIDRARERKRERERIHMYILCRNDSNKRENRWYMWLTCNVGKTARKKWRERKASKKLWRRLFARHRFLDLFFNLPYPCLLPQFIPFLVILKSFVDSFFFFFFFFFSPSISLAFAPNPCCCLLQLFVPLRFSYYFFFLLFASTSREMVL